MAPCPRLSWITMHHYPPVPVAIKLSSSWVSPLTSPGPRSDLACPAEAENVGTNPLGGNGDRLRSALSGVANLSCAARRAEREGEDGSAGACPRFHDSPAGRNRSP